jgi:hypothetical protein
MVFESFLCTFCQFVANFDAGSFKPPFDEGLAFFVCEKNVQKLQVFLLKGCQRVRQLISLAQQLLLWPHRQRGRAENWIWGLWTRDRHPRSLLWCHWQRSI